jgi:hypothetical protein
MRKLEAISAQGRGSSAARVAGLGGRAHRDFDSGAGGGNPCAVAIIHPLIRIESMGSVLSDPADDQVGGTSHHFVAALGAYNLEPQVVVHRAWWSPSFARTKEERWGHDVKDV